IPSSTPARAPAWPRPGSSRSSAARARCRPSRAWRSGRPVASIPSWPRSSPRSRRSATAAPSRTASTPRRPSPLCRAFRRTPRAPTVPVPRGARPPTDQQRSMLWGSPPMAEYHRVIGIDLGTTFSVVAAYSYDKKDVKVIPNRQNEPTTPSVVYVAPDGRVSVGKAAKEKLARDPNRVIFEVKRLMGEQQEGRKAMVHGTGVKLDPDVISAHGPTELNECGHEGSAAPSHH